MRVGSPLTVSQRGKDMGREHGVPCMQQHLEWVSIPWSRGWGTSAELKRWGDGQRTGEVTAPDLS